MGIRLMKHHLPFGSRSQCAVWGEVGRNSHLFNVLQTHLIKYDEAICCQGVNFFAGVDNEAEAQKAASYKDFVSFGKLKLSTLTGKSLSAAPRLVVMRIIIHIWILPYRSCDRQTEARWERKTLSGRSSFLISIRTACCYRGLGNEGPPGWRGVLTSPQQVR